MTLPFFLRPSYWFDLNPPPFLPTVEKALLAFFAVLGVLAVVGFVLTWRLEWDKMTRRALRQIASRVAVLSLVGLLLYSFSYERIPLLSLRAGFLLWIALAVWYGWSTYRVFAIERPALEERQRVQREKQKWLPKKQ